MAMAGGNQEIERWWAPKKRPRRVLYRVDPYVGWVPIIDTQVPYGGIELGRKLAEPASESHRLLLGSTDELEPWLTDFDFIILYSTATCAIVWREMHLRGHLLYAAKRRGDLLRSAAHARGQYCWAGAVEGAISLARRLVE